MAESLTLSKSLFKGCGKILNKTEKPLLVKLLKVRVFLLNRIKSNVVSLKIVATLGNMMIGSHKAQLGKKKYNDVIEFNKNEEANVKQLGDDLLNRKYTTGKYRKKVIYEPKRREIYILSYPHRIVQHALINILEPIFVKSFIKDTYSCIKGRGMHKASKRTTEFIQYNKYCLKMDIRKFYPSINHDILYSMFERKFKDEGLLWLLRDIVYSFPGETNIPIGNLTSQWFGNYYMSALDRFVKEELKIKCYIRYCDDFLLFSNDKAELNRAKYAIIKFLDEKLKLKLSKCDLFPVSRGIDFMGYRHFKNYLLLRKSTAKRNKKKLPKVYEKWKQGKISNDKFRSILDSIIGWAEFANCYHFLVSIKAYEYRREVMAKFSEIASENDKNIRKLEGNSVKIEDWLDKSIRITAYRIEPSKFCDRQGKPKNRIGFEFYHEGVPHVIFTSSGTLIYLIQKYYQKDGLECKIIRRNGQLLLE